MEKSTANFKPCFDWEMAEEPSGEAHQPEESSQPTDTQPFATPPFTRVGAHKLQELLAQGYKITGFSVEKPSDDPTVVEPKRGFCTAGGFVGWWHRNPNPGTGQIWPVAAEGDNTKDKRTTYLVSDAIENFFSKTTEPTADQAAANFLRTNPQFNQAVVGEADYPTAQKFVDASEILESVNLNAYEYIDSNEDWLSNLILNKEKCEELKKIVGDWIENNEPPIFFLVKNIKKFTRAELLESGHLNNE